MNLSKATRLARVKAMAASGEAKRVRTDARLSMRDVAMAVGVDTSTVCKWEAGTRVPRGDAAWRYAELIDGLARRTAASGASRQLDVER